MGRSLEWNNNNNNNNGVRISDFIVPAQNVNNYYKRIHGLY